MGRHEEGYGSYAVNKGAAAKIAKALGITPNRWVDVPDMEDGYGAQYKVDTNKDKVYVSADRSHANDHLDWSKGWADMLKQLRANGGRGEINWEGDFHPYKDEEWTTDRLRG